MGVSDCEEGKRLLEAAAQPDSESVAREVFLEHIRCCNVCNKYDPPIRSDFLFDFPEKAN
jgi:hypothetical protein